MERYYTQTIGADVLTENGMHVGKVLEVLIEPTNGKIVGFLLTPSGRRVISPTDVIFWGDQLVISDFDDVLDVDDLIKAKNVLKQNIRVFKNKVYTGKNEFLGNVLDYSLNTSMFVLTKLFIAKTFFWIYHFEEKTVPHKNILEIKPDRIIVKIPAGTVSVKEKEKAKLRVDIAPTG